MTYEPFESREMSGARRKKIIGLPSATLFFDRLTSDEFQYLLDTFFLSGREEGDVTLRTKNIRTNVWTNFNAVFDKPTVTDAQWTGYEYRDITLEFFDMVEVS